MIRFHLSENNQITLKSGTLNLREFISWKGVFYDEPL